jgi:hypothetical protein
VGTLPIIPATVEEVRAAIVEIQSLDLNIVTIDELKTKLTPVFKGHALTSPIFPPGLNFTEPERSERTNRNRLTPLGLLPRGS